MLMLWKSILKKKINAFYGCKKIAGIEKCPFKSKITQRCSCQKRSFFLNKTKHHKAVRSQIIDILQTVTIDQNVADH